MLDILIKEITNYILFLGEQISALIAGYIDIILRKRSKKERFGEDGNEEEVLEESYIAPGMQDNTFIDVFKNSYIKTLLKYIQ